MFSRRPLHSAILLTLLSGCVAAPVDRPPEPATVDVWYATDRGGTASAGYDATRGKLSYGVSHVRIPSIHVVGTLEQPPLASSTASLGSSTASLADPKWHVSLDSSRPLGESEFVDGLRRALDKAARNELLIIVHGFNTGFGRAMLRAAQIKHDLAYAGVAVSFTWPSAGDLTGYLADLNNADWAAPDLARALRLLVKESGADRVNVMAHSMGNRVLLSALRELAAEYDAGGGPLLGEVILAAPDIDAQIFTAIIPQLQPLADRFTLYVSDRDLALSVSRKMAGGYARAGDSSNGVVIIAGMDTVDTSGVVNDYLGHEYYGESAQVLNDIAVLLRDGKGAADRPGLTRDYHLGRSYWRLAPQILPPA